jgi:uncharacterized protein YbcI
MDTNGARLVSVSVPFACPRSAKRPERNDDGHELVSRRNVWGSPWRRGGRALECDGASLQGTFRTGPTKAHSAYATPDLVICTLEESLTPAERKLVEMGEHQAPRDTRMLFQHASDDEFVQAVEAITGRVVRAFVSGIDTRHDVSSEVFYLEPLASRDGDGHVSSAQSR